MSSFAVDPKVWTVADLVVFDRLCTPVWVFDFADGQKWWANRRGLELWSADSVEHMRERGRGTPMSDATRVRLESLRRRLEAGENPKERWNFYPTGQEPFVAEVMMSPLRIADQLGAAARTAMLIEARKLGPDEVDPFVRRGVEVLRHLPEMVSLYKQSTGEVLMRNPAAVATFGEGNGSTERDAFAACFLSVNDAQAVRNELARRPFSGDVEVVTMAGNASHSIDARETTDPITGERCILVIQRDIGDRLLVQRALSESHRALEVQADELRKLAASPLRVWAGILALPFIGRIDDARIRAGLQSIERLVATQRVRIVLLDLTGAEVVDADAAIGIRRLIASLRLQGIEARVVGLRPSLARTLVQEGIELGDVQIHASLADALAEAIAPNRR